MSACAQETMKVIINDLDGNYFGILVDESKDISYHEQMALALRYVDKKGQVNEPFISLLTLVAVAKKYKEVKTLFAIVANVLNVIGTSFKRRDQLRDHHAELLEQLLESGEVQSGKGLNQELGLQRPVDTRWGSHCKILDNFIILFASIINVLGVLLMSNELSKALQKKEQDIVNAMIFLDLTKEMLQQMRDEGWESLIDEELNSRFDVVSDNLLLGMASLNPANSFANFDKERIMTLAKYYPDKFGELKLRDLSHQLDTFILHMQHGDHRFSDLKGIGDLAKALVEAKLVETYSLVYLLVKLTLILPVATAMVERAFSSMKYIKDELCSSIGFTVNPFPNVKPYYLPLLQTYTKMAKTSKTVPHKEAASSSQPADGKMPVELRLEECIPGGCALNSDFKTNKASSIPGRCEARANIEV
ncbi:uncharacterized protein [Nicotiana tomentosiformis]|uniref:uncharacterized protein n=1 Tax=Nicotiana tomentosiformis TaxID=4098 RepID=UPI00388C6C46